MRVNAPSRRAGTPLPRRTLKPNAVKDWSDSARSSVPKGHSTAAQGNALIFIRISPLRPNGTIHPSPSPAPTARHPSAQANGLGMTVETTRGLKGRDMDGRGNHPGTVCRDGMNRPVGTKKKTYV